MSRLASWAIEGRGIRYEGSAKPGADTSHGFNFTLVCNGKRRSVNVEADKTARVEMTEASARRAVAMWLETPAPPRMIRMDRGGNFRALPH